MTLLTMCFLLQRNCEELARELYRTQMAAAQSALRLEELAEARRWLDQTDPAQRGFEWRVHAASLDESRATLALDTAPAALAAHPSEDLLAVGLSDGRIELRRASDGAHVAELGRHTQSPSYLRFDARGESLISASFDRSVKVWDVANRLLLSDFTRHNSPVGGAAFSPDGKRAASCSYERDATRGVWGVVHVWNPAGGKLERTLEGGRKPLVGLAFSPDGARLAAGSWDFCVFVWSVAGGEPVRCAMPDEGLYNAVDDVLWSADGKLVVGASKDHTARVWDATSGALVASLRGHTDAVDKLALSRDGAQLASAGADGVLKLWSTADWKLAATLRGHADDVLACAFERGGALVSLARDNTLRVWSNAPDAYGPATFTTSAAPYVACYSPDDALLAVASYDGRIELRDGASLKPVRGWAAHPSDKSCHALAWTPDGKRLVSGSWEPVLRAWDAASGAELGKLELSAGTSQLAVRPDGASAAACVAKSVVVWDLASYAKRFEFTGHASSVLAVNFSPDGARCVSTGRDARALVWNAASGELAFEIRCANNDVAEAQFTPDGRQLVVAGRSGAITLHDASSGALVRELAALRHGVDHIDIAPDGSRVALASNVVVLLDLHHGGVLGEFRSHRDQPYNLDFDRTGERLISCSTDRSVVVHDVRGRKR